MDSEIVNTLFCLFNKGVTVDFPCQVLNTPVYFLQCLIYGDSTDRNWTVAYYPFAGFMDVVAGREVHQCVAAPIAAPYSFAHLLLNARR